MFKVLAASLAAGGAAAQHGDPNSQAAARSPDPELRNPDYLAIRFLGQN